MINNDSKSIATSPETTCDDLRTFINDALVLLPARVQFEILTAIQEASRKPGSDMYTSLNHGALLVLLNMDTAL